MAVIDWYSRYVLAWQLSDTRDTHFLPGGIEPGVQQRTPEVFNTDQGAQFTAEAFTSVLEAAQVRISMDGRGRVLDNVFVERLWRTATYEHLYLMDYVHISNLEAGLQGYFASYNHKRFYQSLDYRTPAEVH